MNSTLLMYDKDIRLAYLKSAIGFSEQKIPAAKFFLYTMDKIGKCNWHWLQYFYFFLPPHPIAQEIAETCAFVEQKITGLGCHYVDRLVSIKDRPKDDGDYDRIMQVLAEMLIVYRVLRISWPCETIFRYEEAGQTGKRPELLIESEGKRFLFEVKAPSLIKHVKERQTHDLQVPSRIIPKKLIDTIGKGRPVTLPRDNPIKDFLTNTEEKFSDFEQTDGANVLVIVWDDYIYEPISILVNDISGLLTENSFHKNSQEEAIEFPSIDAVIIVRQLSNFYYGLAEKPIQGRTGIFDYGGDDALPNVFLTTRWGR